MRLYGIFCWILFFYSVHSFAQTDRTSRLLEPDSTAQQQTVKIADSSDKESPKNLSIKRNTKQAEKLIKNNDYLKSVDIRMQNAIDKGAMPGCQIVALKDGYVILEKSYGTFNYNKKFPVANESLYDIASVTKIASTTLAIMKLYEEGKILLNGSLMAYLPMTKGTDKAQLKVKDLLTHQAGLKSWIPFYRYTLQSESKKPLAYYYGKDSTNKYFIPIAKNMYGNQKMIDTVWNVILKSPLENKGKYVYSDLDLLFLEKIVEEVTGMPLDVYVYKNFYKPMNLKNIMYNPWKKGLTARCVPTEKDNYFRYQLVKGYVHDQGAAMMGGVAGHAGLFSNAMDVAAIMQMLLDGGVYNGKRYFKAETVKLFTGYRSSISRRGYGFDKPDKKVGKGGPASEICTKSTFGHQGFTGTCAWADPGTGIVFVLLANRVYPSAENKTFNRLNVRTDAQYLVYKALGY